MLKIHVCGKNLITCYTLWLLINFVHYNSLKSGPKKVLNKKYLVFNLYCACLNRNSIFLVQKKQAFIRLLKVIGIQIIYLFTNIWQCQQYCKGIHKFINKFLFFISGTIDGPGLFGYLITFLSVLLILATLPVSLLFAVKVVQVLDIIIIFI